MQSILRQITVSVDPYLNETKAKLPELEFKTIDGHLIPLRFDWSIEQMHGVKFGQRIETPDGYATVIGAINHVHKHDLYFKLDKNQSVSRLQNIKGKFTGPYHARGYVVTEKFINEEEAQQILRDIASPTYLNEAKAKLPKWEFQTKSSRFIQLKFDSKTEEKYGVKFGQRVETPKGPATVLGECDNQIWFKVDKDQAISYWKEITDKVASRQFEFKVTTNFVSEEKLNKITFNSELRHAIKKNDIASIDALLDNPAIHDIDIAIYFAITMNNTKAVEKIGEKIGFNVMQKFFAETYDYIPGGTHLHAAEQMKNSQMLKTLVKYGANPHLKNANNKSALEIAKSRYLNSKCIAELDTKTNLQLKRSSEESFVTQPESAQEVNPPKTEVVKLSDTKPQWLPEELIKLARMIADGLPISVLDNLLLDELEMLANAVLQDSGIKELPITQKITLM